MIQLQSSVCSIEDIELKYKKEREEERKGGKQEGKEK